MWVLAGGAQYEAAQVVRHFPPFGFFATKQGHPVGLASPAKVDLYFALEDEGHAWRRGRAAVACSDLGVCALLGEGACRHWEGLGLAPCDSGGKS